MPEKHLHIISFSVPYPPNYGGIIDVYYKLVALHQAGVKIHLHCYEYEREQAPELEAFCHQVNYYPRKTGIFSAGSIKPYIVQSRQSEELLNKLMEDDYPILFEGLHSCFYLDDKRIKNRVKIYRESNIEHQYYFNLFKAEYKPGPKIYYLVESLKLKIYEKVLNNADLMLVVSESDTQYLKRKFPNKNIIHLPSFHANETFRGKEGSGKYILYHGNLSVAENIKAATYIANKIAPQCNMPVIFAGLNPDPSIISAATKTDNITLVPNPSHEEMTRLIADAHIHLMITFQSTGLKLKLLNTIFQGRHIIANKSMYNGTVIGELVHHAEDENEFIAQLNKVAEMPFTLEDIKFRKSTLNGFYSNKNNTQKLVDLIFKKES